MKIVIGSDHAGFELKQQLIPVIKELGHDVRAFMPLYASVRRAHSELQHLSGLQNLSISIGPARYSYSVHSARFPGTEIPMFFIDCPEMFDRPAFYTFDADEHRRFLRASCIPMPSGVSRISRA